ncbi:MAG: hypothetical protein JHD10_06435 [Sphingomonadaceae bacterium]|nr:hypothetical protein [Sphingomonadaceae bacterium]
MTKDKPVGPETAAQLDARIDAVLGVHSGRPQVTIFEWALLVRSQADQPVAFEELLPSFYAWFTPGISIDELLNLIFATESKGWILLSEDDDGMKHCWTTRLGSEVLATVERPLMMGGVYQFTGTDLGVQATPVAQAGSLVLPPVDTAEGTPPNLLRTRK